MNGDTGSRGEKGVKGFWQGRGQVREPRKQGVYEWGAQEAGRSGGPERQDWGTQGKGDGKERFHGEKA